MAATQTSKAAKPDPRAVVLAVNGWHSSQRHEIARFVLADQRLNPFAPHVEQAAATALDTYPNVDLVSVDAAGQEIQGLVVTRQLHGVRCTPGEIYVVTRSTMRRGRLVRQHGQRLAAFVYQVRQLVLAAARRAVRKAPKPAPPANVAPIDRQLAEVSALTGHTLKLSMRPGAIDARWTRDGKQQALAVDAHLTPDSPPALGDLLDLIRAGYVTR